MTKSLLPHAATQLEHAVEDASGDQLAGIPRYVRSSANPDEIPTVWLPWLAWARRVETWNPSWAEAQKRQTIKSAFSVIRKKGTIGALRQAVAALNVTINIIEWFEESPAAAPYTFRVVLTPLSGGISSENLAYLRRIIDTTKNARSHLASIEVSEAHDVINYCGAANASSITMRIPARRETSS